MSIDMTYKFTGSITEDQPFKTINFYLPGSPTPRTGGTFDTTRYPYYNETMGTFNLLTKPTVQRSYKVDQVFPGGSKSGSYNVRTWRYRLPTNIEYAVNPAANMDIQDMQIALVTEADSITAANYGLAGAGFANFEGFDVISRKALYRTDYIDIGCFTTQGFQIKASSQAGNINNPPNGGLYIKILVNFKRRNSTDNTQNVLFVGRYPVFVNTQGYDSGDPDPVGGATGGCSSSIIPPPATPARIASLCNDATLYKPNRITSKMDGNSSKDKNSYENEIQEDATAYRNPTSGTITIKYGVVEKGDVKISLSSQYGILTTLVDNANHLSGNHEVSYDVSNLPSGVYYYTVQTTTYRVVKRIILIK